MTALLLQNWNEELSEAARIFSLECTIPFSGASTAGFDTVGRTFSNNDPNFEIIDVFIEAVDLWVARIESYDHEADQCLITIGQCSAYRQVRAVTLTILGEDFGCFKVRVLDIQVSNNDLGRPLTLPGNG